MTIRSIATCMVLLVAAACKVGEPVSTPGIRVQYAADGTGPTILVTNATCSPGPCASFDVRAWVPKFLVPGQPPSGALLLGSVEAESACLRVPSSVTLTVTGPEGTTRTTWTPDDPIYLTAVKSLTSGFGTSGTFVPSNAAGWTVTFPGEAGVAQLAQAATPCSP